LTASQQRQHALPSRRPNTRRNELWIAISIIFAAALATFLALFIHQPAVRSGDCFTCATANGPLSSCVHAFTKTFTQFVGDSANEAINLTPTPATPGGETSSAPPDDASIQSHIDATLTADPTLSKLDVSALVENGKVTIVGSVRSVD